MTNDQQAVTDLVTRLYALLDEGRYDELGSVYAEDVELQFPSGRMRGLDEVTAVARRRGEHYERVQHMSNVMVAPSGSEGRPDGTDVLVDLDADAARIPTNHWAVHIHAGGRFEAGLVHRFDAVRTPAGWRLSRGSADVIWRAGEDVAA
jgi:ketosteroid isomerase-like protein